MVVNAYENDLVELWMELKRQFQLGALERQLALRNQLNHIRMKGK